MSKCSQCRKNDVELLTRWERVKNWLFRRVNFTFFSEDFDDLRSELYTQGYTDGNIDGVNRARKDYERNQKLYS